MARLLLPLAALGALSASLPAALAAPAAPSTAFPLRIDVMRQKSYPGSAITLERELRRGSNYRTWVASYRSDGLKIYALLTVPRGSPPAGGWPAVIFNHGYIPPEVYRTTERYVAYQDAFARAGFVTFKSDYRGHGSSQGAPTGAYWSPDYTTDVLNAVSSVAKYPGVNAKRLGMWGHSMGGHITLRSMVIDSRIKAGVIWAGVVAPYPEMLSGWRRRGSAPPPSTASRRRREEIFAKYGSPETNPAFWNAASPNSFLKDVSGPLQIHHGTADADVPLAFSQSLVRGMKAVGKTPEFFTYPGDDHNLSRNLYTALNRSVAFFKKTL